MHPTNIKCLIVEDEIPAQKVLQLHIGRLSLLSLEAVAGDAAEAKDLMQKRAIDLIFADIHLPGMTGLQLAKILPPTTGLILTTAHHQYALKGFELNAVDYLLKPISFERFEIAVNRYLRHFHQKELVSQVTPELERSFLFLRCERKMTKIYLDEILYLEAQRNCLLIQTTTIAYKTYQSITEVEEKLPVGYFLRVHRSFIVSLTKVISCNTKQINIGQFTIPIGRLYQNNVTQRISPLK